MNFNSNTGSNIRQSGIQRKDDFDNRNLQNSSYNRGPTSQGIDGDGGMDHNLVYRSYKFPEQVGFDDLVQKKQVLQQLLREFRDKDGRVVFEPYKKEEYSKRLMLLQNEIQGLMRQSFLYSGRNPGQRTLDYSALLNQKENQVNQLQRKIAHLQAQLRMRDQREIQLEKQLQIRFSAIKSKNDEIEKLRGAQRSYNQPNKNPNQAVNGVIRRLMSSLDELLRRGNTQPAQLETQIQNWILGLPNESTLKKKYRSADENWLQDKYKRYVSYVTTQAASLVNSVNKLYTSQISNLKSKGTPAQYDPRIMQLIGKQVVPSQFIPSQDIVSRTQILSGVDNRPLLLSTSPLRSKYYDNVSRVTVQVPVQDTRTKALIHRLASQMRRLYTKYPKLATQISPQLSQFFSQEILDVIQVDQLDRLVEIVKYKPDIVKVQNVYAFNSEKNRRVQFHLKVLIKALLQQMQKMKLKTGIQPQIDQGVIGMIRQQIMDVVNVDDILRVYRVVPKTVQVQKIVQQVVQKIVPVPHFVTVQRNTIQPIPVNTVSVVKDTVNVPLAVPRIQTLTRQKLLLGNQYQQRVVPKPVIQQNSYQTLRQIPRVRQVQKVVQMPQQVVNTVQVPGPERIVPVQRQIVKNLIQQKVVPVERIVEKIVQVQKIVEKIVPVIQQVIKIVEVDRIVEKAVPVKQYLQSQRVENYVVEKPVEVICYVQKIVPVQRIVQSLITHPQIVEKLVPLISRQQVIKQVQIIKEVPVIQKQIIVQDRLIDVPLPPLIQQVATPVDQIIQVPFIHEKVRVETEYRKQPVIERQHTLVREAVNIEVPVILYEDRVTQIQKPKIHLVKQQYPKEVIREKMVPIQTVRDQLIPTPFIVEKIIEKIVQVPRIVEIEKIVEKIVPVPRIIEKIVEVEKIIEKIVERNIYHTNLQPVELLREVPIQVQTVVTIQIPEYIYQTKEVPHIIQRDRPVVSEVRTETVRVEHIEQPPRVTIQRKQIPIEIIREKVAPMVVQEHVYVELKEQIVIPMEIPVPQTIIQQRLVPVEHVIPVMQPVDRIIQKIVEVRAQMPGRVQATDRLVQKLFVQNQVKVVRDQIPYYNQQLKQVPTMIQKIVPVQRVVLQIMQVPYMVQKLVNQIIQVPNIYQIDRIVQVPVRQQQLITIDRIVPKIVTLNKAFAHVVDKLHEFPRLAEEMKQVQRRIDNLVVQRHNNTDLAHTEIMVEKAVIQEKLKQVDKYINVVNQSLSIVDRIIEKPTDPIIITEQKIIEVPVIVEKLAERIVIMPQVVQVLKYIHQITDNDNLGVALTGDVAIEEGEYQRLGKNVNRELANLRNILLQLKRTPGYQNQVTVIDQFLSQFNKFLVYPRIRQVMTQKVVNNTIQRDKIVKVPVMTSQDEKRNLASAVLIDKLLMELKRVRMANPNAQLALDPEIMHIFGDTLDPVSLKYGNNYNQLLDEYSRAVFNKFNSYGTFTPDHHRMLRDFIDERFQLANRLKKVTKDSTKYKQLYSGTVEKYNRQRMNNQSIKNKFDDLQGYIRTIIIHIIDIGVRRSLEQKLDSLNQAIFSYASGADTPTYRLQDMSQLDKDRANRYLREKDLLIADLKRTIDNLKGELQVQGRRETQGQFVYGNCNIHTQLIGDLEKQVIELRRYRDTHTNVQSHTTTRVEDHSKCQAEISRLTAQLNRARQQLRRLKQIQLVHSRCRETIQTYQKRITILQTEITRYKKQIYSLKQSNHTAPNSVSSPKNQGYGRNFMEYIDQKDNNSDQDRSVNSDYNRGVYRSAGNYGDNNGGGGSMGYIPAHSTNYLSDSRHSGDLNLNNRPMIQSNYQAYQKESSSSSRSSKLGTKQIVFNKQENSRIEESEGGSSGLYGNSTKEIIKRTYREETKR